MTDVNHPIADLAPGADDSGAPPAPRVHDVRPVPSDAELAAIMAAVEVAWPRPGDPVPTPEPARWRFSGRWWSRPLPARRDRP